MMIRISSPEQRQARPSSFRRLGRKTSSEAFSLPRSRTMPCTSWRHRHRLAVVVGTTATLVIMPSTSAFSTYSRAFLYPQSLFATRRGAFYGRRMASLRGDESCVIPSDDRDNENGDEPPLEVDGRDRNSDRSNRKNYRADIVGSDQSTSSPMIVNAYKRAVRGLRDNKVLEALILGTPFITPVIAFIVYADVARLFRSVIELIDFDRLWIPVDGQAYQITILTPTIIGIVVPTITILFATLVSVTVSTLRQRQLDIRSNLNLEACEIRRLQSSLWQIYDALPPDLALRTSRSAEQYVSRILGECERGVSTKRLEFVGVADSELSAIRDLLNGVTKGDYRPRISSSDRSTISSSSSSHGEIFDARRGESLMNNDIHDRIVGSSLVLQALEAVANLNAHRAARLSALQSAFPPIHFAVLGMLGVSIIVVFLIETDQDTLAFLDAVQLKILFSILVGVFTSAAVLISDLQDPFRGSYLITPTIAQLYVIRDTMAVDRVKIEKAVATKAAVAATAAAVATEVVATAGADNQQLGGDRDLSVSVSRFGSWGGSYMDEWQNQWDRHDGERNKGASDYMKALAMSTENSWIREPPSWNPYERWLEGRKRSEDGTGKRGKLE